MSDRILLGAFAFHPGGAHVTGWRHPSSRPAEHLTIGHHRHIAQSAERGFFDTLFLADGLYFWDRYPSGVDHYGALRPEPFTLLAALSQVTSRIGLAATVSTTYNEPYHVARTIASLDHISRGRAAWNLVTSRYDEEARNFGGDAHIDHSRRYERGREFVDVVHGLLDSWDDDAIRADAASGIFADRDGLHRLDHDGESFRVRGPLNIAGRRRATRCCSRPAAPSPASSSPPTPRTPCSRGVGPRPTSVGSSTTCAPGRSDTVALPTP